MTSPVRRESYLKVNLPSFLMSGKMGINGYTGDLLGDFRVRES